MHARAVDGPGSTQCAFVVRTQELRIAQLYSVGGARRQCRQELAETRNKDARLAREARPQWRELKQQGAELRSKSLHEGLHYHAGRKPRVEKHGLNSPAHGNGAVRRSGKSRVSLHHKAKMLGHLRGITRELLGGLHLVKRVVEIHGIQKWMPCVCGEPISSEQG